MSASPWLFTALAVLLTAVAHSLFKIYATVGGWTNLIMTVGLFLLVPASTYVALRQLTLAQVYLCTAAVPAISLGIAHLVFDERISRSQVGSTVLIMAGIVLYQSAAIVS